MFTFSTVIHIHTYIQNSSSLLVYIECMVYTMYIPRAVYEFSLALGTQGLCNFHLQYILHLLVYYNYMYVIVNV